MSTALPGADEAWVEEGKIKEYLLNLSHAKGGPKARFFMNRGFTAREWVIFQESLVAQGQRNPVVKITPNEFGTRYQVECKCVTPDGLNPCIRTVWEIKENRGRPRLITAHPLDPSS